MSSKTKPDRAVAVVGMACRLPAARDVDAYWSLLQEGRHGVSEVSTLSAWDRERAAGLEHAALLDDVAGFDAPFFRISPREADAMDPQQRLLMELSWHALEDAGIAPSRLRGTRAGVYVGISGSGYALHSAALPGRREVAQLTGALCSIAANRLSYFFGAHGPSLAVDTACSSSLVALHLACEGLAAGDADLALAGGVSLILDSFASSALSAAGVLSADGRCKSFDARADGYVRGEGAAVLVLRPLAAARRDGDRIYAVIRGSAVNQDGASNGLMAPNRAAQEMVIARAWERAGVEPWRADYVEAHGTGTLLGDPIEARALGHTVGRGRAGEPCRVGTSKTNLGHLEAAAGVAGVVKCCLMMHRGRFVPSLNFEQRNPYIPLERLNLTVQTASEPWPPGDGGTRLAGVSSFGIGGTNAHVVLESEPGERVESGTAAPVHPLLPLAAASAPALEALRGRYARLLEESGDERLLAICHAAATQREPLDYRFAGTAGSAEEMKGRLREPVAPAAAVRGGARIAFLFTGQGSQRVGMGAELFEREPLFRRSLERTAAALDGLLERPLLEVMFGVDAAALAETVYAQPAIFALQVALAEVWSSWGIRPAAVLGHSVGELAAACVAGAVELEDAVRLVAWRGQAMQESSPEGAMLAVTMSEEEAREPLAECEVELAAVNSPRQVVFSGRGEAIGRLAARLDERGIPARRFDVRRAFHSALLEPVLPAFERRIRRLDFRAPSLPFYSNVTGGPVAEEMASAEYWVRQARSPARFADGLRALVAAGCDALLEIGSVPILLPLARETVGADPPGFASLRPGVAETRQMAAALGGLFERGATPDWERYFGAPPRRVASLPRYPFEPRSHWLAGGGVPAPALAAPAGAPARPAPVAEPVRGDAPSLVAARLSAVTGHPPGELSPDARLADLGLSSIGLVELAAVLADDVPALRSEEPAWGELQTVADVVELIAPHLSAAETIAPASPASAGSAEPPASRRAGEAPAGAIFIATEIPAPARERANRVLDAIRGRAGGVEAGIVVDPRHPFFFDHPYDHVPGVLLVEAVQQLGEWLGSALDGDSLGKRLQLDRLGMRFESWADLDAPLRITADSLTRVGDAWHFEGAIGGERRCARFEGRFRAFAPEPPGARSPERPTPAEPGLVHKRRPENVLISRPTATGEGVTATALPPAPGHSLCDGPSELVPATLLAEWTRQFLTARAHVQERESFDERFILLSLHLRLSAAVARDEPVTLWSPAMQSVDTATLRLGGARVEVRRGERALGRIELYGAAADEEQYERARWGDRA